jgi:hypothetical protein
MDMSINTAIDQLFLYLVSFLLQSLCYFFCFVTAESLFDITVTHDAPFWFFYNNLFLKKYSYNNLFKDFNP